MSTAISSNGTSKVIRIAAPPIERITIRLVGTSPLMTNRFSDDATKAIASKQSGEPRAKTLPPRDPEREFRLAIHRTAKGEPGIGAWQIAKALSEGYYRIVGKYGTELEAAIQITATDPAGVLPLDAPPPEMDERWGRLGGKVATMLYRPRYWPWSVELPIAFQSDLIRASDLVNHVQRVGFSIGIGAGRRIGHGRFTIEAVDGSPLTTEEASYGPLDL